jgi:hypothetical protein
MPYTYDDYLGAANTQRTTAANTADPSLGYSRTSSSVIGTGPNTTQYTAGQSNREFVRENLGVGGNRYSTENMAMGMLNPVAGVMQGFRGYSNYKKGRAAFRRQQAEHRAAVKNAQNRAGADWFQRVDPNSALAAQVRDRTAKGQPMTDDEINQALRQQDQTSQREGYEQQVNDYFGSEERAGWQQGIVQNRLQNDLANVEEDYGNNLKGSVQSAASRGLKGGSVDVEGRGQVARTRDTQAIQAASNADQAQAQFRTNDQQSRAQLLGLVNSGDISDADALRAQLDGIHSATTSAAAQYAGNQQQRQINQFGQQQQSQAWGSGLNSLANAVDRNPRQSQSWFGGSSRGGW